MMDEQGKETIVEALIRFFKEGSSLNEDSVIPSTRTDYRVDSEIETAEGKGKVKEKYGSVVVVEMEDGSEKTFTLNVLDKHNAMNRFDDEPKPEERAKDDEKAERDAMRKDRDQKNYPVFGGMTTDPKSSIQDLLKKLKGLTEKLKMKKEELFVDPKNPTAKPIVGASSTTKSTLTKAGMKMVPGTSDAK
jgi:hypothetical protein